MDNRTFTARYFDLAGKKNLYSSRNNLKFYLTYIFNDISFENKLMLDIGGGSGLFSFYAACKGAREVICLEPGMEGFLSVSLKKFKKLQDGLGDMHKVRIMSTDIQSFNSHRKKFDIILLHNSINHLDENACINLTNDIEAQKAYEIIFHKLRVLSNKGAKLIIADCSNYNFFPFCKLINPFAHDIEWHKHQAPEIWIKSLRRSGFKNPVVRWRSFDQLRSIGRFFMGNKIAAYFLQSHFCLTMEI